MKDKTLAVIEAMHRKAIEELPGSPLSQRGSRTIHFPDLPPLNPSDALFQAWNTYRKEVGRLLAEGHEGKVVLVYEETIIGLFDQEETALAEGYQRYSSGAFLVHQIREKEPTLRIRGQNLPWPSSSTPLARPAQKFLSS